MTRIGEVADQATSKNSVLFLCSARIQIKANKAAQAASSAALSGSLHKASGFAGGYLLGGDGRASIKLHNFIFDQSGEVSKAGRHVEVDANEKGKTMLNAKILNRSFVAIAMAILFLAGRIDLAKAQESAGSGTMHHGGGMSMGSESGGMGHGGMMGHDMEHGGGTMGHMMMCHMAEHVEGRLAYAKAELKITDAQLPQWNAFADAFRASAKKMRQHCMAMGDHGEQAAPTGLIEHLGQMEQHMAASLDAVRAVKAAAEPLFKTLTDEQKKAANELPMLWWAWADIWVDA